MHALSALGVNAHEVVFIDDRESNVLAARRLGLEGLVYRNAEHLEQALSMQGILRDK